jgi:HEAT repeat protein
MSSFTRTLSEGDLRSDGFAGEVARLVVEQPALLPDLMEALAASDPSVRGHAADALEKVARHRPREVRAFLPRILRSAVQDDVAMVRWHLAMVLGHLSGVLQDVTGAKRTLLLLLKDESAFVRSWAVTSLCIIARQFPSHSRSIAAKIVPLASDSSAAVAKRARTALRLLADPGASLPKTWIKSSPLGGTNA